MNGKFLKQWVTNPMSIGAICPSSKKLAIKMMENVDFKNCKCVIELGPGSGVFTEEILKRRDEKTIIMLIECNNGFSKIIEDKYGHEKNVHIINDSAENIDYYLEKYNVKSVDYIVSGLPFASLPKEVSEKILWKCKQILGNEGSFITFQYTKLKKSFISGFFMEIKISKEVLNIPPAYVFTCKNPK